MRIDKSRLFKDAHAQRKHAKRMQMELSFADALRRAWQSERQRIEFERQEWMLVLRSFPLMPFDLAL